MTDTLTNTTAANSLTVDGSLVTTNAIKADTLSVGSSLLHGVESVLPLQAVTNEAKTFEAKIALDMKEHKGVAVLFFVLGFATEWLLHKAF